MKLSRSNPKKTLDKPSRVCYNTDTNKGKTPKRKENEK
jgi:hypothetical protein